MSEGRVVLACADVVVVGGGVAGVSAAWTLAAQGADVVVVEPTGVLGREVTRERSLFVDVERGAFADGAGARLAEELHAAGAVFPKNDRHDAAIDAVAAGLAFDRMLADAGVEVLFHCRGVRMLAGDRVEGAAIATRNGMADILAPLVVDASRAGRIAAQHADPISSGPVSTTLRAFVNRAPHLRPLSIVLHDDLGAIRVQARPTFWPGESRLDATPPAPFEDRDAPGVLARVVRGFRQLADVEGGVVTVAAEEVVRLGGPVYQQGAVSDGLVLAGAWTVPELPRDDAERIAALVACGRAAVADESRHDCGTATSPTV